MRVSELIFNPLMAIATLVLALFEVYPHWGFYAQTGRICPTQKSDRQVTLLNTVFM